MWSSRKCWKIFKNNEFGFKILEKGHILRPFSCIAPTKMKMLLKNVRIKYVYIYIYVCICIYIGGLYGDRGKIYTRSLGIITWF